MRKARAKPIQLPSELDSRRQERRLAKKHLKSLRLAAVICGEPKDWRIAQIEARIAKLQERKRQLELDYLRVIELKERADRLEHELVLSASKPPPRGRKMTQDEKDAAFIKKLKERMESEA